MVDLDALEQKGTALYLLKALIIVNKQSTALIFKSVMQAFLSTECVAINSVYPMKNNKTFSYV